jgi:hypothetical protein
MMTDSERLAKIAELRAQLAALETPAVAELTGPLQVLRDLGEEFYARECASAWAGSPLETINKLKPDSSGKVGELFLLKLCTDAGMNCVYTGDVNSTDGKYDVVVNGKQVEVKTARLGAQHGFQHESLRAEGCDYYAFVDITPTAVFVTVIETFNMTERHPVLGRKPHLRKGTTDVYKFDFGMNALEAGVRAGCTLKVDATTPLDAVGAFLCARVV